MERLARAKINLTLQVTGRRDDGYHLLDSIVVFADYGDRLSVEKSTALSLKITGPFAKGLTADTDNLVIKAAHLLREKTGCTAGAALGLEKNLPLASGIGGGSADAAAALDLLNEFWQLKLTMEDLREMALQLGADVPVCLLSRTALMQGIGERLSPLSVPTDFALLLVNPAVAVSTPAVFKALDPEDHRRVPARASDIEASDFQSYLRAAGNDLEPVAVKQHPVIGVVLDSVAGLDTCRLARMSGSGATCFGLFDSQAAAQAAQMIIAAQHPEWWTKAVSI